MKILKRLRHFLVYSLKTLKIISGNNIAETFYFTSYFLFPNLPGGTYNCNTLIYLDYYRVSFGKERTVALRPLLSSFSFGVTPVHYVLQSDIAT